MKVGRFSFQRRISVKRSILIISVVLMALFILNNQPASATIITVEVEGIVDSVTTDGGLTLDGSVGIDSVMTGFCSYDTEMPDQEDSDYIGIYSVISVSMTIGNYTFTHNPTSLDLPFFRVGTVVDPAYSAMTDGGRFDGTVTVNGSGPLTYDDINWNWTYMSVFHLRTSSSEYIPTDALPDLYSWPDLSVFDENRTFDTNFYDESNRYFDVYGEVTSLTVTPEPATVFLLALGGLALLRNRRFR